MVQAPSGGVNTTFLSVRVASQDPASASTGTEAPAPTTANAPDAPSTLDRSSAKSLASRFAEIAQAGSCEVSLEMTATWSPFES